MRSLCSQTISILDASKYVAKHAKINRGERECLRLMYHSRSEDSEIQGSGTVGDGEVESNGKSVRLLVTRQSLGSSQRFEKEEIDNGK